MAYMKCDGQHREPPCVNALSVVVSRRITLEKPQLMSYFVEYYCVNLFKRSERGFSDVMQMELKQHNCIRTEPSVH